MKLNTLRKCPNWIIEQTIEKVKNQNEMSGSTQLKTNIEENKHMLMLPYQGKVGETTLFFTEHFKICHTSK